MKKFQSIMNSLNGSRKSELAILHQPIYHSDDDSYEERIFHYDSFDFSFTGTSFRTPEKQIISIFVPWKDEITQEDAPVYESYILRRIYPAVTSLSNEYVNINKDAREKAQFSVQKPDCRVLKRSGIVYHDGMFEIRINYRVPLLNAMNINSKATVRSVKELLSIVSDAVKSCDSSELAGEIMVYHRQIEIRRYLVRNNLAAFVGNSSILPRENGTNMPMRCAVPFSSPESMMATIEFSDGTQLCGMAIKRGVTVITGGGYSGKSTLLDALESGIYNHIAGDGREYVIADSTSLKTYAEDSRPVMSLDISPFFKFLPGSSKPDCFSTRHASGSVSQAANIVEAVIGGSKLLLIDEDKSATNFMIRDKNMRDIVKNEPIIPFTDRVRELYEDNGVSTILVIGGSSEYLSYADTVILMEDYKASDITNEVRRMSISCHSSKEKPADWQAARYAVSKATSQPFLYFKSVETENEKKIILDDYSADITMLAAIKSSFQMNTLAYVMEQLLTDKELGSNDVAVKADGILKRLFADNMQTHSVMPEAAMRFYEEIRTIDALCCLNRMRGVEFTEVAKLKELDNEEYIQKQLTE